MVPIDQSQAFTVGKNACEKKDAIGCTWLGVIFTNGSGVPRDIP